MNAMHRGRPRKSQKRFAYEDFIFMPMAVQGLSGSLYNETYRDTCSERNQEIKKQKEKRGVWLGLDCKLCSSK